MGQALATALPGMAVGAALALKLALAARSALFGVTPLDPIALAAGPGALAVIVVLAAYVPSRRATRTDPVNALRS